MLKNGLTSSSVPRNSARDINPSRRLRQNHSTSKSPETGWLFKKISPLASPSARAQLGGGWLRSGAATALPLRKQLHRATVKGELHSCESRIRENAGYAIGIEDFQTQISARRHDFRGTCGLKIDGVTSLFPRRDGALLGFTSDVISMCDKAATKLFGKLNDRLFLQRFCCTGQRPSPRLRSNRKHVPAKLAKGRRKTRESIARLIGSH